MLLGASLITSFSTTEFLSPNVELRLEKLAYYSDFKCENRLNGQPLGVDLYLFVQEDSANWANFFGKEKKPTLHFLAELTSDEVRHIARELYQSIDDSGLKPVAVTSFVPEICFGFRSPISNVGTAAIQTLMKFAIEFASLTNGNMILQLVAGSAIRTVGIRESVSQISEATSDPEYEVLTTDSMEAFERIDKRLGHCFRDIRAEFGDATDSIRVAMELEPGPLFLLKNGVALTQLTSVIENSAFEDVRNLVGFNADIAHWCLAGINKEWMEEDENRSILGRVFHSHISGHSLKGHFGDFSLAYLDDEMKTEFKTWLGLLNTHVDMPEKWSRFISVEYEVAKDREDVSSSVNELVDWLEDLN